MLGFKEWALVVEALIAGKQTIILRKGGIHEGDFEVIGTEFYLLPTVFHQSETQLKPFWYEEIKHKAQNYSANEFVITHKAIVTDSKIIKNNEELLALDTLHVWTKDTVLEKFHRWQKHEVHCLYVETQAIENKIVVPNTRELSGCKSWVEIN